MTFIKILVGMALTTFTLFSCERIKRKKDDLSDKVFAKFDPVNPDTRSNKKRFSEFFGFAPTSDITDLYCYSDRLGIDAAYYFAFKCNEATLLKIKEHLELSIDPSAIGLSGFDLNYEWWDNNKIATIKPLTRHDGTLYWYLWYDGEYGQVYFLTFDT